MAKKAAKTQTAEKPKKRPVGRPSKYDPEFCHVVLALADDGLGPAAYAVQFDVDKATLYRWAQEHPDFATALQKAKAREQVWWEQQGRMGLFADKFNATVWQKTMAAKFRDDYTEKTVTEVTGANGGPMQVEAVTIDPRTMTAEERAALAIVMKALKKGAE